MDNTEDTIQPKPRSKKFITDFNLEGLKDLTESQMKFVQGIWKGLSAAKAYQAAFDCGTMSLTSITSEASRLRNNPTITQWINAGYAAHLGAGKVTIDEHLNELRRLKGLAIENNNISAAVQAETVIGKAAGLHIDRVQQVESEPSDLLAEIAKFSPAYAKQLAEQAGMTLEETDTKH